MSSAQVLKWLEDATEDLTRLLAPTVAGTETKPTISHATRRLFDARPALPGAQAFDSDRVSSSGSSSKPPPGFGQEDRAKADRDEMHVRARRMREDADWLVRCAQRWNPREATNKDRTLAAVNEASAPSCEHCARFGQFEASYVEASDAKGNLSRAYRLGYFCYRFALDTGSLPSPKQLEQHHQGQRVLRPA